MYFPSIRNHDDKRQGPDLIMQSIRWFGLLAWSLLITVGFITAQARPQEGTFFDKALGIQLRTNWNENLVQMAFYLTLITFAVSCFGLLINSQRHCRKEDHYSIALILATIISATSILIYSLSSING